MTQQPNWGQQQAWPQQQAPQNMAEAWPPGQGPADAAPAATPNQNESGGFFGGMGGSGEVIPSFKFGGVGSAVQGQVQSTQVMDVTVYGTDTTVVDEKTNEKAKQLKIVLQTQHRNWEHVAKIPTDEDGNQLPPSADDGRRAVYTGGKSSRGQSWMSGAINDALRAAGREPSKGLEIGAMLGVAVTEEVPTNYGNPYRKYVAKYASPSAGGFSQQQAPAPQQQAQPQQQAPQQPAAAPQGPPPAENPFQGYQPPQQPATQPQGPAPSNPWGGGGEPAPF